MVQLTEHHGLLLWKNNMDNITITEKAKERLVSLMQDDKTNLELSVLGGGCSGMSYSLKYTDREPTNNDKIYYFGEYPSILKMIVPFASYVYLIGTEVDFSDDLLNGGFRFNNPQSNRECGCGISFSV